ncbi:DNA-directed DNA polymerase epsilon, subunit B [Cladophialophora chaetospira]|uniref:DNA polymerase epsilon subunit B n=1 Tax=Cladophialophora chaetospira TaxID=386627 RepID=A0AA38WXJ4_9EURO|nr:DNA-directed DNA polymerase epsilon, subunit B [Cladophialophora chaetospira]
MEEPVSTPGLPARTFKVPSRAPATEQILSSSPGFGTPAYPLKARPTEVAKPFPAQLNTIASHSAPTVLPILLPPQTLRPVAFRTLTKKHNLTLTSSGLGLLSTFIGKFCGSGWREEGLAERLLDEIAKSWKKCNGGLLVEDGPEKRLSNILKSLEPCMSGGRVDVGKLSRSNSSVGSASFPRSNSFANRPDLSRDDSQASIGISGLNFEDDQEPSPEDHSQSDIRSYLKVISAFDQPRLMYSTSKKSLEPAASTASLLPPIQHKISMFRNRYHLVHQRLMRNESFQAPSFSTTTRPPTLIHSASSLATQQNSYKITPISNLLGRSGSAHLLLGVLVHSAAGDLALTDLSGSVVINLSVARPVPEDGAWFCPGMIVLVEGTYEEDGSQNSNLGTAAGVGGQIKGIFVADTMAGPPAERRALTLGISSGQDSEKLHTNVGAGFGWIDFLGTGSEKALGPQMRRLQSRYFGPSSSLIQSITNHDSDDEESEPPRSKIAILGECTLDSPRTLEAIRAILSSYHTSSGYVSSLPLSIVLMGNFVSAASMAGSTKGGGSVEYKEHFDALASVLSEFNTLLANVSFVFVPGDNDPWQSSFSAGGATMLPRLGVPEVFTSRVRRAVATANTEVHGNGAKERDEIKGEVVWATNPARMSLFGPVEEIVLFRDDMTGRFRRNAVAFAKPEVEDEDEQQEPPQVPLNVEDLDLDKDVHRATSHLPATKHTPSPSTQAARKLIKTLLDQSNLSPFPVHTRPQLWDHASSLSLYPLPTALVLCDAEMPAFAISYEGCHVMNVGRVVDELGMRKDSRGSGVARWIEYDVRWQKGEERIVRF